ncbi:hypothetical protein H257_10663 [Aphanomyces astaci]|uniref:Uncharacterized protein n=1 Tax=Aphanomyces astaci TaxID=112090 RepID=W4G7Q8_APHAT|nr:hypothetical protein H257_10663 [Aphanomyces astaci]ETV75064.1 hypothetical protein H257_10663 [Aphanomyces astaci]|eukprot:XP_009835568.1 hypothetical protein H257_10663 [Aphanomyces astaci]
MELPGEAEGDSANLCLYQVSPPVLPDQLIKLRTDALISDVLEPRRSHIMLFWSPEDVEQIEDDAIYDIDNVTKFDEDWDIVKLKLKLRGVYKLSIARARACAAAPAN